MSNQDENTENESRQIGVGPGERLQAARIKKGLSLEDVANRMHLSSAILEAIEENDFDEITAPIFVKGYLRAYARIVSLNEDEMIQQYVDFYSDEDPPIGSTSNMAPELTATDARIKWTTYLVIVVLAVLLGAWWWNKQQTEEAPISLDSQAPAVAADAAGEQGVVESNIQAGSESPAGGETAAVEVVETVQTAEPAQPAEAEAAAEAPIAQSDAGTTEPEDLNAEADSGIEVDSEPPSGAETVSASEPDTSAAAEAAAPAVAAEPEAVAVQAVAGTREQPVRIAPVGSDKLQIIVNADTWADVKDANNYQLLYDLLRADSVVEVSGEAPFVVFLGNGHGVEILFNGEEIEFTSRIRNDNTARINVGS
jgi:cytoskeleton protein RodZ